MKQVTLTLDDDLYAQVEQVSQAQGKSVDEVLVSSVKRLTAANGQAMPDSEQRRKALAALWQRIDTCNVAVGEKPTRARTYDHRRFHRY